jgi:uncharacterized protein (TIGR02594 family)
MAKEAIRTIRIVAKEEGADKTVAAVNRVGTAVASTADKVEGFARVVDRDFKKGMIGAETAADGLEKKTRNLAGSFDRLQQKLDPAYRAAKQWANTQRDIALGFEQGAYGLERQNELLGLAALKYGQMGKAALAANQNLAEMTRTATNSAAVLERVNRVTGVTSVGVSVGRGDDLADYGRQLDALRAKYNPLFAIGQQYKTQVDEIRRAHSVGAIGVHEMEEAIAQAGAAATAQQTAYARMGSSVAGAGASVKLTSHQVANLGYQVNDVATMLAMGASPFQVISSQAGQVVQALGDGPGGMMGSLQAIGSSILGLTRFITPLTIGLTAAAGAVAYFALRNTAAENSAASSEKAVKAYTDALKDMRTAAGDAGKAAGAIFDRETTLSPAAARAQLLQATEAQRQARADATEAAISRVTPASGTIGGLQNVFQRAFDGDYSRFISQMEDAVSELARGKVTATEFQDEIAAIRTNPLLPESLKAIADGLSEDAKSARAAEASVIALRDALKEVGYEAAQITFDKLRDELEALAPKVTTTAQDIVRMNNEAIRELGKLDPTKYSAKAIEGLGLGIQRTASAAFDELSRSAREAAQDAQAALTDVDASPLQRQINQVTREYQRQREEAERTNGSSATLSALRAKQEADIGVLIKENTRAEEARRAGYALDIQAIGARDAATKASIEAERTRIDLLSQGYSAAEAQARASGTLSLSLAQAAQAEADSLRQRNEARTDALSGLQLEMQTLGQTAGETARLTTEYQLLQEAKRAAYDEGRSVGQDEIDAIKRQAVAVGEVTQKLAEQKLQQDILFERSQIGLSDQEQAIRERLKSSGIDIESANGKAYASQIRYNDALQESVDLAKDFAETLIDGLSSGEGVLKSLTSAFAQLGQQMASKGLNMLFDGLMGGGGQQQSSAPTVSNALGALGQVFSRPSASQVFAPQTYAAPTVAVQRAALAPLVDTRQLTELNDNLRQTSRSAMDVAMNFSGLTEKANSPVLDSFMQASGTWGKLSAKSTAWCAAFANAAIIEAGGKGTGSNLASSFLDWGQGTNNPKPGDIVVLKPQAAGASGHVGFFASMANGEVQIFGGNQGNAAKTSSFAQSEVRSYRTADQASNENVLTKTGMTSAVSDGVANYSQKAASGAIPGVDPWRACAIRPQVDHQRLPPRGQVAGRVLALA